MTRADTPRLAEVLWAVAQGFGVLPLDGKNPGAFGRGWQERAHWTEADVRNYRHMFDGSRRWNVGGLFPVDVLVIDIDTKAPGALPLADTLAALDLTPTLSVETGGVNAAGERGQHHYYKVPAGFMLVDNHPYGDELPGVEMWVGGAKRQMVLPPSVHPDTGHVYRWMDRRPMADLPEHLRERLHGDPEAKWRPAWMGDGARTLEPSELTPMHHRAFEVEIENRLDAIREATDRHDTLIRQATALAGIVKGGFADEDDVADRVAGAWEAHGFTGQRAGEWRSAWRDAMRYADPRTLQVPVPKVLGKPSGEAHAANSGDSKCAGYADSDIAIDNASQTAHLKPAIAAMFDHPRWKLARDVADDWAERTDEGGEFRFRRKEYASGSVRTAIERVRLYEAAVFAGQRGRHGGGTTGTWEHERMLALAGEHVDKRSDGEIVLTAEQLALQHAIGAYVADPPVDADGKIRAFVVAGRAGSGKTTVSLRVVAELGLRVGVLTPTWRAADVNRRKGALDAQSIHMALVGHSSQPSERKVEKIRSRYDILLIDEASMCSQVHVDLVEAANLPTIVVGDPQQLAPMPKGTIAPWMVEGRPDFILRETHRFDVDSPIGLLADDLYEYGIHALSPVPWEAQPVLDVDAIICWSNLERFAITGLIRGDTETPPEPGEPIMFRQNAPSAGVWNRRMAVVVENLGEGEAADTNMGHEAAKYATWRLRVQMDGESESVDVEVWQDGFLSAAGDDSERMESAPRREGRNHGVYAATWGYVHTAHSAQGGEYDSVLVVTDPSLFIRPDKDGEATSWVYTAITRAASRLAVATMGDIRRAAVRRTTDDAA